MKKFYFLPLLVFPCLISAQDVSTLRLDSIITTDNDEIVVKFEKYKYDDNNNQLFKTGYDNTGNYLKMDSTIQIFDANNRVTFLEKRSYPKTSKYPGWKGSGKEFTSYYDNDKVHTKLSLSFNQPNSDADGYYYESSKAQYTYNEDGTTASYLMSSGQWNTTLTDKILYTYEYDDLKRVTTQNMYKKDDNGEWTLPDSKKINVYTINPKYPESETLMNYDGENFVNKSRVTMTFHP